MKKTPITEAVVVLEDIRSAENVGSIFRTADACGVSRIYLSGYTPTPLDRFGRASKVGKSALGAERSVSWEKGEISSVLKKLKVEGFFIVAAEQSPRAVDYKDIPKRKKMAFIFGNEVSGVSKEALKRADMIAEIAMLGEKESLNVSVAAGMILSRVLGI
ncbi:MAG TPA: TrmH family RNA methyltransferase [Candidatus Paceibacterota bacterium]|nr:TrmH family RNA methyltransferase [Candidatus Paceibacterota bacterium]